MFDLRNGLVWSTDSLTLLVCMSCLKEGLYCSKLSCRVTIRGWVSQDFTSGRSKCLRGERLGKKWTLSNTLSKGCPQHGGGQFTAGLVTNSILSCLRFASRDNCKNVCFLRTQKQSLHTLCPGTSIPRVAHLTVSLHLFRSGSNAQDKVESPWRVRSHFNSKRGL